MKYRQEPLSSPIPQICLQRCRGIPLLFTSATWISHRNSPSPIPLQLPPACGRNENSSTTCRIKAAATGLCPAPPPQSLDHYGCFSRPFRRLFVVFKRGRRIEYADTGTQPRRLYFPRGRHAPCLAFLPPVPDKRRPERRHCGSEGSRRLFVETGRRRYASQRVFPAPSIIWRFPVPASWRFREAAAAALRHPTWI